MDNSVQENDLTKKKDKAIQEIMELSHLTQQSIESFINTIEQCNDGTLVRKVLKQAKDSDMIYHRNAIIELVQAQFPYMPQDVADEFITNARLCFSTSSLNSLFDKLILAGYSPNNLKSILEEINRAENITDDQKEEIKRQIYVARNREEVQKALAPVRGIDNSKTSGDSFAVHEKAVQLYIYLMNNRRQLSPEEYNNYHRLILDAKTDAEVETIRTNLKALVTSKKTGFSNDNTFENVENYSQSGNNNAKEQIENYKKIAAEKIKNIANSSTISDNFISQLELHNTKAAIDSLVASLEELTESQNKYIDTIIENGDLSDSEKEDLIEKVKMTIKPEKMHDLATNNVNLKQKYSELHSVLHNASEKLQKELEDIRARAIELVSGINLIETIKNKFVDDLKAANKLGDVDLIVENAKELVKKQEQAVDTIIDADNLSDKEKDAFIDIVTKFNSIGDIDIFMNDVILFSDLDAAKDSLRSYINSNALLNDDQKTSIVARIDNAKDIEQFKIIESFVRPFVLNQILDFYNDMVKMNSQEEVKTHKNDEIDGLKEKAITEIKGLKNIRANLINEYLSKIQMARTKDGIDYILNQAKSEDDSWAHDKLLFGRDELRISGDFIKDIKSKSKIYRVITAIRNRNLAKRNQNQASLNMDTFREQNSHSGNYGPNYGHETFNEFNFNNPRKL